MSSTLWAHPGNCILSSLEPYLLYIFVLCTAGLEHSDANRTVKIICISTPLIHMDGVCMRQRKLLLMPLVGLSHVLRNINKNMLPVSFPISHVHLEWHKQSLYIYGYIWICIYAPSRQSHARDYTHAPVRGYPYLRGFKATGPAASLGQRPFLHKCMAYYMKAM